MIINFKLCRREQNAWRGMHTYADRICNLTIWTFQSTARIMRSNDGYVRTDNNSSAATHWTTETIHIHKRAA